MSSLQILQPISTLLVAHLRKQVSAKSAMICQPNIGDVIVYDRSSKRPHGHIQIFDGTNSITASVREQHQPIQWCLCLYDMARFENT